MGHWRLVRDGLAPMETVTEIARHFGQSPSALRYHVRQAGVPSSRDGLEARLAEAIADWRRTLAGEVREPMTRVARRHAVTVCVLRHRLRQHGLATAMPDPLGLEAAVDAWTRIAAGQEPPASLGDVAGRYGVPASTLRFRAVAAGLPTRIPGLRRRGTTRRKAA